MKSIDIETGSQIAVGSDEATRLVMHRPPQARSFQHRYPTVGSFPHLSVPVDDADERASDTPQALMALVRSQGVNIDTEVVERIDRALGRATADHDLGMLYLTRAIALQARGSASAPAAAARNAIPHLVEAGAMQSAALASAVAAIFIHQTDDPTAAMNHAVDALVMLGDAGSSGETLEIEGVRAALALSGFFMRISAFNLAVESAGRAFESAQQLTGLPLDPLAYSVGYVAAEGAHVTEDNATRDDCIERTMASVEWLQQRGIDDVSRVMLAVGLHGEARHAAGRGSEDLDLEGAAEFYDQAPDDLVAWHRLVRAASAKQRGDIAAAIDLFDEAIPGLIASADNHCLVRALRGRAEARAESGDHAGAYADAADLAARTRHWQISQVEQLAAQLARRADLERSKNELQRTAERLANDIDRDATTGVNSRRWLDRRLDELADTDEFGSALMCDIDRFKNVNDTYGHHVGDDVLREFGNILGGIAKDADIARFGGEEFAIVLHLADAAAAVDVAEQLRQAVERHDWSQITPDLKLTVSCGVAYGHLSNIRSLLVAADEALLEAKHSGRNLVRTQLGSASH